MNRKLTAGVITGLLLAPTTIANAQENDAQSRVTTHTEQVAYTNEVAAATTREQLIAQFGKLSEDSLESEMVLARGDLIVVQNSGDFNSDEKAIIKAKYEYVEKQRQLLLELKEIGIVINKISYSSSKFNDEVKNIKDRYDTFLGNKETTASYLFVQDQFKKAIEVALINNASGVASDIRKSVLQYGYEEEAPRNTYFKGKGADIDKLNKLISDSEAAKSVTDQLMDLDLLNPTAINNFTTTYNALTADQKKVVEAYNPKNETVTPFKKYKDALTGLSAIDKISSNVTQLMKKKARGLLISK
ncbi:hypothetical protein [Lysinibacillus boronitolerans]|uniref:hypothetical protein n=1 Tax=Lysinibacillus boronitolerans TaxID=309788 RepID=UPI0003074844|nr:hypothetical protein [Lysinibacillus boronitolerans]